MFRGDSQSVCSRYLCKLYKWTVGASRYMSEPISFLGAIVERFANSGFSINTPLNHSDQFSITDNNNVKYYFTPPSLMSFDKANFNITSTALLPRPLNFIEVVFSENAELSEQKKYDDTR